MFRGQSSPLSKYGLYSMSYPFTFTNMGATGATGLSTISYSSIPGANTPHVMTLSGGIQYWTVPYTARYDFTIAGAGVTNPNSLNSVKTGYGIELNSSIILHKGHVIAILVGQSGLVNGGKTGGCGGTFVYNTTTSTLLLAAGGAGGIGYQNDVGTNDTVNGTVSGKGRNGQFWGNGVNAGIGGIGPNGATTATNFAYAWGDGGAGFSGNGAWSGRYGNANGVAYSFMNGGKGGTNTTTNGGFGGGGCAGEYGGGAGGGGGGYGGGGAGGSDSTGAGGGGGGSYDITNVYWAGANNADMGKVKISIFSPSNMQFELKFSSGTLPTTDITGKTLSTSSTSPTIYNDSLRGYVLKLNGTFLYTPNYDIPASYTKMFWLYSLNTNQGSGNVLSSYQGGTSIHYCWYSGSTYLGAGHSGSGAVTNAVTDPSPTPTNTWIHFAITYDQPSLTMKMYRNGALVASSVNNSSLSWSGGTGQFGIGTYGGQYYLNNAYLDNIRIFNIALTLDQISTIYYQEKIGDDWDYDFNNAVNYAYIFTKNPYIPGNVNNSTLPWIPVGYFTGAGTPNWLCEFSPANQSANKTYEYIYVSTSLEDVGCQFAFQCDNECALYLNNIKIGTNNNWQITTFVTASIKYGTNRIHTDSINYDNNGTGGFICSCKRLSDNAVLFVTDSSWKMS